jgi:uracil-DNA glycosylase family 4
MSTALEELAQTASTCTRCRLSAGRTQVVFADGSPTADLMFIGEGPGYHEDIKGLPFVGAAGQLLNTLLAEINLGRDDTYICNVVKCRPPGNRDPLPDEIEACRPYLTQQIELVDPKLIVTLGNFATRVILDTRLGISRVRGQRFPWNGRLVIPTFHPAAVLRGGGGAAGSRVPRQPSPSPGGDKSRAAPRIMQEVREDFETIRAALDEARAAGVAVVPEEQLGLF